MIGDFQKSLFSGMPSKQMSLPGFPSDFPQAEMSCNTVRILVPWIISRCVLPVGMTLPLWTAQSLSTLRDSSFLCILCYMVPMRQHIPRNTAFKEPAYGVWASESSALSRKMQRRYSLKSVYAIQQFGFFFECLLHARNGATLGIIVKEGTIADPL